MRCYSLEADRDASRLDVGCARCGPVVARDRWSPPGGFTGPLPVVRVDRTGRDPVDAFLDLVGGP
jgi:hypothetical protein